MPAPRPTLRAVRSLARYLVMAPVVVGACLPTATRRLSPQDESDAGTPPAVVVDGGSKDSGDVPVAKPHALLGVDPQHGPFNGGTLTAIRGKGFAKNTRVWFGELEATDGLLVLDAERLQVPSPPADPGRVDVVVQNGDDESTRAKLEGGFTYDAFYLDPTSGPTAGGTVVTIHAESKLFDDSTVVTIDQAPCAIEQIASPTELTCRTPPGTPGAKPVKVTTGDDAPIDVLDAFSYVVSTNGYKGGLSGDKLDGQIDVLVLDDLAGEAVPGATVLAGTDAASALVTQTDSFGTASLASDELGAKATITVAKKCFQPQTFIDVPVQKLTVFLEPELSPACGDQGDIPAGGGVPGKSGSVSGELVWPYDGEVRMNGFGNVPAPNEDDVKRVAYVFRLGTKPTDRFSLPSAVSAITPDTPGTVGYGFYLSTPPGNFTLYALAGLETKDRVFTPYALGLTRGVAVGTNQTNSNVFIQVDLPLDHTLHVNAKGPTPTERGPDRLEAKLAIEVGSEGYVLLPNGLQSSLLPGPGTFDFVGIPPLTGSLTGTRYIATALAATGDAEGTPRSAVGLYATVTDTDPIGICDARQTPCMNAFVEVPTLVSPASSTVWNRTSLELTTEKGGPAPDVTVVDVSSGNNLVTWRIIAPGAPERLVLPDLLAVDPELGLVPGVLAIDVKQLVLPACDESAGTAATPTNCFTSYGALATSMLAKGYRAYAEDVFFASY